MNENQNPDEAPLVPPAVSQAASQLGKRGRGRPKTITESDRQRRSEQMQQINEAYERMLKSDVKYRFVIDMASLKG